MVLSDSKKKKENEKEMLGVGFELRTSTSVKNAHWLNRVTESADLI